MTNTAAARFSIQSFHALSPVSARVVAATDSHVTNLAVLNAGFRQTMGKAGERMALVPGTQRTESVAYTNSGHKIISAVAICANAVRPSLPETYQSMTCVTANVWMDNVDKTMWRTEGEGDDRRLVCTDDGSNLAELLSRASSNGPLLSFSPSPVRLSPGEVAIYFDTSNHQVRAGFALPGSRVYSDAGKLVRIDPASVTRTFALQGETAAEREGLANVQRLLAGVDESLVTSASAMVALKPIIDYWSTLFGRQSPFVQALVGQVREAAV